VSEDEVTCLMIDCCTGNGEDGAAPLRWRLGRTMAFGAAFIVVAANRLVDMLRVLRVEITALDAEIAARAKRDVIARRLMTIPGVGPVIATALQALAPPAETFRSGRDFAAWAGLTPIQKTTGSKPRMGRTSRMGERTLRRLLIMACSGMVRWAKRKGAPAGSWLARLLVRKPPMLVTVGISEQDCPHCVGTDG
jgi:transposase